MSLISGNKYYWRKQIPDSSPKCKVRLQPTSNRLVWQWSCDLQALNRPITLNVLYYLSLIVGPAERLALDRSWTRVIMMAEVLCSTSSWFGAMNDDPSLIHTETSSLRMWNGDSASCRMIKTCPLSISVQIPWRAVRCSIVSMIVNGRHILGSKCHVLLRVELWTNCYKLRRPISRDIKQLVENENVVWGWADIRSLVGNWRYTAYNKFKSVTPVQNC